MKNILKSFSSRVDSCSASVWFSGNFVLVVAIVAVFLKFFNN